MTVDEILRLLRSTEKGTWYKPRGEDEPFDLGEVCHAAADIIEKQNEPTPDSD
jgi:hypothetical protein